MRRARALAACLIALSAVAACGSDKGSAVRTTLTVTASSSAAQVAEESSSSTGAVTPTTDSIAPAAPAADAAGGIPSHLGAADANVNEGDFYGDGGQAVYFRSPSGNVTCSLGFSKPQVPPACQARVSVQSAGGPHCDNTGLNVYASEFVGGVARSRCVTLSTYVGDARRTNPGTPYGGRVLDYGQTISILEVTCTSTTAGITCFDGAHGFTLARDRNAIY